MEVDREGVVAVFVHGGLGNQMFQVAAAYALARRNGCRLIIDASRIRRKHHRPYALTPFDIQSEVVGRVQLGDVSIVRRVIGKLLRGRGAHEVSPFWRGPVYKEESYVYSSSIEGLGCGVALDGYFQSPKYFGEYSDEIACVFDPIHAASSSALRKVKMFDGERSVAVHIRRGDYVTNKSAKVLHGVLPFDYYDRALNLLRKRVGDISIFVFSDDYSVAKEAAGRWGGAVAVRGESDYDDLYLMSCARHHVIANSTFSWWSSWLDRRSGSTHIAPLNWFCPAGIGVYESSSLYPSDWILL